MGGGGYKPLIATSLALALGVSVASATTNAIITADATLSSDSTIAASNLLTDGDNTAGILFKTTSSPATLTMNGNLSIDAVTSTDKNAYGILIDSTNTQKNTFSATAFKTISIAGVTTTDAAKEAYVFKNAGSGAVEFVNTGIAAGTSASGSFGIYNNIAGAKYNFGTAGTTFTSATTQGIVIADSATFEKNLTFTAVTGGAGTDGAAGANANDNGSNGIAGGNAYGITATTDGKTLTLDGNITFTDITGGAGGNGGNGNATGDTNGGNGGNGGDAYGIYLSGSNGLSISGSNNILTFTAVTGGNGGTGGNKANSGTDGASGTGGNAYIINNTTTNKTLALDGVAINVGSGSAEAGFTGITTNLANAKFNFGSGSAKTTFGAIGSATNSGNDAGKSATALNIAEATTLSGKLEFGTIQGQNGGAVTSAVGKSGGNAYGIVAGVDGKILSFDNANISFGTITGGNGSNGNGDSNAGGVGGSVAGISLSGDKAFTISGSGTITFAGFRSGSGGQQADSATTLASSGSSYVIDNENTASGKDLSVSGVSIIAGVATGAPSGTYGIYSNLNEASYVFGKTDTKTILADYSQGMILAQNATLSGKLSVTNTLEAGTSASNNEGQENVVGLVITGSTSSGHNLNNLHLSVSSTNGDVVGVKLVGETTTRDATPKEIAISGITFASTDTLTANNAAGKKAIVLSNTGLTNFSGVVSMTSSVFASANADKIVLDNQGELGFKSANALTAGNNASVTSNRYSIFAGIADAQYNFGTKTTFAAITDTSVPSTAGAKGNDAVAIYLADDSVISGNAEFSAFAGQAGESTTGASGVGNVGGSAYGITALADRTLTFNDANLKFGTLTGGAGAKSTDNIGGAGGSAAGLYVGTNNLTISGSGSITFTGFAGGAGGSGDTGAGKEGNTYVVYNSSSDKTLTLSGVSVVAGSLPTTPSITESYGIYNQIDNATYAFGSKSGGGTILSKGIASGAGSDFTGIIFAHSENASGVENEAYIFGNLQVNGQAGNGQAKASGDGMDGGDAVGLKLVSGTVMFDTLNLGVTGGAGSAGTASGNKAGNGGDAIGIKASRGILELAKGASQITATAGDAGATGTGGSQGDAYGIYTEDTFTIEGLDNYTLTFDVSGNNAYGLYLGGDSTAATPKQVSISAGNLVLVGSSATSGAVRGVNAYGIYNAGNNTLSGNIVFGDGTKASVGDDTNTQNSYGVYNDSKLAINGSIEFKDASLVAKSGGSKAHIYNAGEMTFAEDAKVFAGTAMDGVNVYADSGKEINLVMAAGSTTTFNGTTAAFGVNEAGTAGKINLDLQADKAKQGAKLVFNGAGAGDVNILSGSNAEILLSGDGRENILARINSAKTPFDGRVLQVADMQLTDSNFVLAAKSTAIDAGAINSDQVVINGSTTATKDKQINNTLYIVVDNYTTDSSNVATLATVDSSVADNVVFNGLYTDSEVDSTIYSGFTTAEVKIKRTTDSVSGDVAYTSTLESANIQVNEDFVAPTTAALSAGVSLFSANLNSLSKRMGELRNDPYSQGVWARVFGGSQTTNFGAKQTTLYSTVQAGYDYKLALDGASNYIGVALSYTKGSGGQVDPAYKIAPAPLDIYVSGLSSSSTDGVEIALYNSYVAESGLYSDSIVKFGYYMNDLTMFGQEDTYSTNNLALAVSEEIGYKFKLGAQNEWFITPQGEVAFAYMGGSEFTQNLGADSMKSTQDATSLLRARVGAAWGYDFSHLAKESDVKASIYLGTYYTYDYFIGGDTTLSTTANGKAVDYKHNAYEGTGRFVMNLGTNIDVQDRTKVYFDFEKSFGGNIQTDYQVSLGVRFGLGEKISKVKQEKKSSETILKPQELENNVE